MAAKLISIIGPPAVGKTTLASALATELGAELIREDYAGNPFLAESYHGREDCRLPGQLYFLMSRVNQLSITTWPAAGLRVTDYAFAQDRIFAQTRLASDEFHLYDRLARRMEGLVQPPDLLIHLDAAPSALLGRIADRGREFEKVMGASFLDSLRVAYAAACTAAPCPVLYIDTEKHDLRQNGRREEFVGKIKKAIG